MRTVEQIIDAAGRDAVVRECGVTPWALKKWPRHGIPEKHWPHLIEFAGATPDELFEANRHARRSAAPPAPAHGETAA